MGEGIYGGISQLVSETAAAAVSAKKYGPRCAHPSVRPGRKSAIFCHRQWAARRRRRHCKKVGPAKLPRCCRTMKILQKKRVRQACSYIEEILNLLNAKCFKKPKVCNTSSLFRACQFPLCMSNGGVRSHATPKQSAPHNVEAQTLAYRRLPLLPYPALPLFSLLAVFRQDTDPYLIWANGWGE